MSDADAHPMVPAGPNDIGRAFAALLAYLSDLEDGSSFASDLAHLGASSGVLVSTAEQWERWGARPASVAELLRSLAPHYCT